MFVFALFDPKGITAFHERDLIVFAPFFMMLIVIPVLIALFMTAWKYRVGNDRARYNPDQTRRPLVMMFWWILPALIILVISILNWHSTHALDPYQSIDSSVKPLTIQVVAIDWKWLFIYPEQGIATVNFLEIPDNTPIQFELTADGPMNSFWIPQLAGQMYAMPGMSTKLHVLATETGDFQGSAAEINGSGFAGMRFITRSASSADFNQWVQSIRVATSTLTWNEYQTLAQPSENNPITFYSSVDANMYNKIIGKFMPQ